MVVSNNFMFLVLFFSIVYGGLVLILMIFFLEGWGDFFMLVEGFLLGVMFIYFIVCM